MTKPNKAYRSKTLNNRALQPETLMMGFGYDPHLSEGALKVPIFQTSTFVFKTAAEGKAFFELAYGQRSRAPSEDPGLIYSRINNPDLEVLEDRLALWDEAEDALTFSSGMAAISTTLWSLLRPGDVLLHSEPVYGGTEFLIRNILPQFGIEGIGFRASASADDITRIAKQAATKGRVGAIYIETPANPTNSLVDIRQCARISNMLEQESGHRPPVIVDNTFLGPLWQKPLKLGADLVIYSLTKYIGGHSDVIAGACLGSEERLLGVKGMRTILGTMTDPHTCWLLMRSLETLKLRMTSSMEGARHIAEYLAGHSKIKSVRYLGFLEKDDPQYELYQNQCKAPGSTFAFEIYGGESDAFALLDNLKIIKLAVSLGGTESLIEHPATMTHSDVPQEVQERLGITESLLRLSVGIEHPDDLIADLSQALETL